MSEHTPGPWFTYQGQIQPEHLDIANKEDGHIAACETPEDAEFIVRACNSHDDLLAACEAAIEMLQWSTGAWGNTREEDLAAARETLHQRYIPQLNAVIAKARGKSGTATSDLFGGSM